jgi:hypothetical protein
MGGIRSVSHPLENSSLSSKVNAVLGEGSG